MSGRPGAQPRRVVLLVVGLLVGLLVFLGVTALLTLISTSIWPGQAGATARWVCDADHPDHLVVATSYQTTEGTATETTLYCIGPRGDAVDVGWGRSWRILWVVHAALTAVVLGLLGVWAFRRRSARSGRRPGGLEGRWPVPVD